VNTSVVGSYQIRYNATDSEGNVANEVIRTITVQDTTHPYPIIVDYSPDSLTSGDVEVNITINEPILRPDGRT
jgi:hypothetical protein